MQETMLIVVIEPGKPAVKKAIENSLSAMQEVVGGYIEIIPVLNQAYCPDCGKKVLARMQNYPEDRPIAKRREEFYMNYYGIKEDRPAATGTASSNTIYGQSTNPDSNCQDTEGGV